MTNKTYYTQRDWDRTVGYGKVPKEYEMNDTIKDYKKRMNYDMWEDIQTIEVPCKEHPDAPHGFDRTSSHSLGRYVCECEGWIEDD